MEKIIFEDLPSTNTPLNAENLNKIQENVEVAIDEVDNKHNYLTDEQVIGTWIDGRPVYRKVIESTVANIASEINSLNFDYLLNISAKAWSDYESVWNIPNYHSESSYIITFLIRPNTKTVEIGFGNYFSSTNKVIAIIEYTKTTDIVEEVTNE